MSWTAITNYLAEHWLEIAGTVTTVVGIWLTTRRLLICWPVVLAADFLYLAVFFRARLFSDALLQVFFVAFTLYGWWTGASSTRPTTWSTRVASSRWRTNWPDSTSIGPRRRPSRSSPPPRKFSPSRTPTGCRHRWPRTAWRSGECPMLAACAESTWARWDQRRHQGRKAGTVVPVRMLVNVALPVAGWRRCPNIFIVY